jgi:antitoxin component YwqK of YwqJK toxin-antitoxin module
MRIVLTAFLLFLALAHPLVLTAQSAASPEEMEEHGGILHKAGDKAPYTGLVQDYHQSGKTRLEARYEAGKLVSSKVWYENGQLAEEVSASPDNWAIRRYGENGRLEEETLARFKDGRKLSEQSKVWYENGQLRTEAGFLAGKLHGPLKEYDPSGILMRDELYEQGKLVSKNK